MKKWKILYCTLFFGLCLIPSVGLLFGGQEESLENRTLTEFPRLKDENGINTEWLSQAGDYFQEHFAFRNELVTANAILNGKVLKTSTAPGVIQGKKGWLYYTDSLPDYLGTEPMSERSLFNLAHTLAMMQDGLQQKNVQFLFTVAPNKNSLYGDNMPYYDSLKVSEEKNILRLKKYLEQENVEYADLYEMLGSQDEVLYHKTDSHWNNKGASVAADLLLNTIGKDHYSYENSEYEIRKDFSGDLDKMLYPMAITPDEEIYYKEGFTYDYVEDIESTFDTKIHTTNNGRDGSLVMYRDSFGNALLPFMAENYGTAYFSRGVPYQLSDVDTNMADTVIVERAERFLPEMVQSPPVMDATLVAAPYGMPEQWDNNMESVPDGAREVKMIRQGMKSKITGIVSSEYLDTDTRIYVRINDQNLYEAFPMDVKTDAGIDNGGFCLYLSQESFENNTPVAAAEPVGNVQAAAEPIGNVQAAAEPIGNVQLPVDAEEDTDPTVEIICETNGKVVSVYNNTIREEK